MMDRLQEEAEKLRRLGYSKPNCTGMSIVREAMSSKWEGIQSIALQVLGQWGGKEAIEMLRSFLVNAYAREYGWTIRGVAVRSLAKIVGSDDVDWVLALYFSLPGWLAKHELLPVVLQLPPERARTRLTSEPLNIDPVNRQAAAKAIGNMPFEDRIKLLKPLCEDESEEVRATAKALTAPDYRPNYLHV